LVFDEILYIAVFKVAGYESAIYFAKKQNGGPEMATINRILSKSVYGGFRDRSIRFEY
jgi:hypothetical protein